MPHLRTLFNIWSGPLAREAKEKEETKSDLKILKGRNIRTDKVETSVLTLPITLEDSESGERDDKGLSAEEKQAEKNLLQAKESVPRPQIFHPYVIPEPRAISSDVRGTLDRDKKGKATVKRAAKLPTRVESYFESLSVELVCMLVGRVSHTSSLRFSVVDSMYLSSAILKVRKMKKY